MQALHIHPPIDHATSTLTELSARVRRLWNSHPPQDWSVELSKQLLHIDLELEKLTLRRHFGTPTAFDQQETAACEARLQQLEERWFQTCRAA